MDRAEQHTVCHSFRKACETLCTWNVALLDDRNIESGAPHGRIEVAGSFHKINHLSRSSLSSTRQVSRHPVL